MTTTGLHPQERSGTGSITGQVVPLPPSTAAADVFVVAARPEHLPLLEALIERTSLETRYRRFHGIPGRRVLAQELHRVTHPSAAHRSVVAFADGAVVGIGTLAVSRSGDAEVALLVEDAWQGRGVGRLLMDAVGRMAAAQGLDVVHALVLGDNGAARRFFLHATPGARAAFVDGLIDVVLPTAAWQAQLGPRRTWTEVALAG